MITGRDIAEFVTQVTGEDYLSMYEDGKARQDEMTEQTKNKFSSMFNRMNEASKKNQKEVID